VSYDLVVVGGGSGGVRAARMAAGFGAKVLLVERDRLGGTCVNLGCIPKKLFHYAARFRDAFEDAAGYGWTVPPPRFDWSVLLHNKNREIERLNGVYGGILQSAGVEVARGTARLEGPSTVVISGDGEERSVPARQVLLAVGGRPQVPAFPGREHVIVSDAAFSLPALPRRAVIIGGGYVACEFASLFQALGVVVTMVVRGEVLSGFDEDVRASVQDGMTERGVSVRGGVTVASVARTDQGLLTTLSDGTSLASDLVFAATGRVPATDGLGLDTAGIVVDERGAIPVDPHYATVAPGVYAVGDCIDRVQLTPVALAEGMAVARRLFGGGAGLVSYEAIPTAVFCQPEAASVGLTEAEARARHAEIDIYRSRFRPLLNTLSGRAEKTMMKIIVDRASTRVLGIHVVGPEAGEIVQGFAVAVRMGATKADLDLTIGIHPTAAEELVTMRTPVG
jgi:glutathione reductase (NADPH)